MVDDLLTTGFANQDMLLNLGYFFWHFSTWDTFGCQWAQLYCIEKLLAVYLYEVEILSTRACHEMFRPLDPLVQIMLVFPPPNTHKHTRTHIKENWDENTDMLASCSEKVWKPLIAMMFYELAWT